MDRIILNCTLSFLLLLSCAACQRPMYADEDEVMDDGTRIPLKVSTRSESGTEVDYPAYIYVFDTESGGFVDDCSIINEDDVALELELLPGEYDVVAVAGVGDGYDIPERPDMDDLIVMNGGYWSGQAMMQGRSRVTVKSDTETSLNITLYYAVASVEVALSDIPASIEDVSFRLSPLYSSIAFSGDYFGNGKEAEMKCTKGDDGIWRTEPFYIFPGSGTQTSFSITLKSGGSENIFGYTFNGRPEAKVPLKIKGNYKGQITISGSLIAGGWETAEEVTFDFGPQADEDGNEGNGNDQPELLELPEVGDIIEDAIVVAIEEVEGGGYDVLMMKLEEWSTNEAGAEELLQTIQTDWWELPLKYEADLLKANFGGGNLSQINELIAAAGEDYPLLKVGDERYLCENNNELRSFSFESGGTISALGNTKVYYVRLIQWVHYETE